MNEIVLVGNGPSLLEQRLGAEIDAFPRIVRFNGYMLDGFAQHVGTKTTIWSRWYALPEMRPMETLDRIWLNMPLQARTPERLVKAFELLGKHRDKVDIVPNAETAVKLQAQMFGCDSQTKWPSSGLLAIAHCVEQRYDVWIAGFDSWSKEPFHYYGVHDRTRTHHVAEFERAYISGLVANMKVRILKPKN